MTSRAHQPVNQADVEHELAVEQAHVDRVYAQLERVQRAAQQQAADGQALYTYDRADFAREEDTTALFERDAFTFQAARRLAILDSEHEGLVFGRLDMVDDDTRYIGRIGVRDDEYEPLVIDWRAPASAPFYRATPAEPMGVTRRRVLRCRAEQVVGIEDDLLDDDAAGDDLVVVGEGALMAALARARGPQMRDIVATIQAEQDEAIRAPYPGVTVISGGPGTGKTVVALHRAAYLLYSNRRRFEHGGVMVVGPSSVFMSYIDRVLPSLGEDSVTLRALGQVATDVIGVRTDLIDPPVAAAAKGSLAMVPVLRRLVAEPLTDGEHTLRITVKGEVLTLSPAELTRIRRDVLSTHQMNRSRAVAETALLNALWAKLPPELLDREPFDQIVLEQASFTMFLHAWWPVLTPERVLARLGDPAVAHRVGARNLTDEQIDALVPGYAAARWTVADMALLDELQALLGPEPDDAEDDGSNPAEFLELGSDVSELVTTTDLLSRQREADPDDEGFRTFAHVLVDEAQDITPMQWRMLRRRGPQASWTIVGDPAQSSWGDAAETRKAVDDLVGSAPRREFSLSTNYRSPAEVFDLAATVVRATFPDAQIPTAIRRTGIEPRLLATTPAELADVTAEALATVAGEVDGTIGVIAPSSRAGRVREHLLRRAEIDGAVAEALPRVAVLSPLEAKGLEYDATLVIAPDDIVAETSGGVRTLYVALTRPTQRLTVVDVNADARPGAWRAPLSSPASDSE